MSSPFILLARSLKFFRVKDGFKVDSGKDRSNKSISLLEGDTFNSKVSTKDTDGDIYVFESSRIKEGGPFHHYHFAQDEWWYVSDDQKGFAFVYPDYTTRVFYPSLNLGYRAYGRRTLFRIGLSPGLIEGDFAPGGYISYGLRF